MYHISGDCVAKSQELQHAELLAEFEAMLGVSTEYTSKKDGIESIFDHKDCKIEDKVFQTFSFKYCVDHKVEVE